MGKFFGKKAQENTLNFCEKCGGFYYKLGGVDEKKLMSFEDYLNKHTLSKEKAQALEKDAIKKINTQPKHIIEEKSPSNLTTPKSKIQDGDEVIATKNDLDAQIPKNYGVQTPIHDALLEKNYTLVQDLMEKYPDDLLRFNDEDKYPFQYCENETIKQQMIAKMEEISPGASKRCVALEGHKTNEKAIANSDGEDVQLNDQEFKSVA